MLPQRVEVVKPRDAASAALARTIREDVATLTLSALASPLEASVSARTATLLIEEGEGAISVPSPPEGERAAVRAERLSREARAE